MLRTNTLFRIMSICLSVILIMSLACPIALASTTTTSLPIASSEPEVPAIPIIAEPVSVETISEYDMYLALKSESPTTLHSKGLSVQEATSIVNSVEQELLSRASLSNAELYDLGYTDSQIEILRAYDGSALEDNPQLRAVLSNFRGDIYTGSTTSYGATMRFEFSWTTCPASTYAFCEDYLSVSWRGTNTSNLPCTMRHYTSFCNAFYSDGTSRSCTPSIRDQNLWLRTPIYQSTGNGNWLRSGTLVVQVVEAVTVNDVSYTVFGFNYAHSTATVHGSVSIDTSGATIGFDLGLALQEAYNNFRTVYH